MPPLRSDDRTRDLLAARAVETTAGCLLWQGYVTEWGYGRISYRGSAQAAHRVAFLLATGSLPADMDVDHLCHTRDDSCPGGVTCQHRRCVNPDHMELVTHAENTRRSTPARKTRCRNGHERNAVNTYTHAGRRSCRPCNAAAVRRRKQRLAGAA